MRIKEASLSVTREEFVRNLSDSGLLSKDDLRQALNALADQGAPDGGALAHRLVGAGRLTAYQAVAVLERRFQDLRIGNYEVLDLLGKGGMGTVYKARHRRMKRVVALKVLAREAAGDGSFLQRFQREVETIAQLSHPNIVMAFDADEYDGGPFLVMEFVDGRDLATEVEQGGPLSVADAVDCAVQAARGLAYAHGRGLVHRDVKPANLLRDVSGVIKAADLGLARLNSPGPRGKSSLTQAGGIVGTLDFMAPEQAVDSTAIDRRADVYSLGCTLYFLLTGRPPYQAPSLMGLLLMHRDAPLPSLSAARPDVPAALDAIWRRMAAKKPDDRFPDMAEAAQALEALQSAGPLPTAPPVGAAQPPASSQETTVAPAPRTAEPPTAVRGSPTGAPLDLGATVAAKSLEQLTQRAEAPGPPSDAPRVADLTVVLAEQSRVQAGIVRSYLQKLGVAAVHSAASGRQAAELTRQHRAQVLLSTMHLSDMTGVELGLALRADPACAGLGVILATTETDADRCGALRGAPRTVLLPKPFDQHQLAQALAQVFGRPLSEG
jgi:serine/threonine-protein kinase